MKTAISFPVHYRDGAVYDSEGRLVCRTDRESGSPFKPTERDENMRLIARALNVCNCSEKEGK